MENQITKELDTALQSHHGMVQAEGTNGKVVVMTMEVYRQIMGVGDECDFNESVQAIKEALMQVENGDVTSMDQVFRDLDKKYGVHG